MIPSIYSSINQSITLNKIVPYEMAFHHDIFVGFESSTSYMFHISRAFSSVKGPLIFSFLC